MAKKGRPVGTTKANGYKVSPGRPKRQKIRNCQIITSGGEIVGIKTMVSCQFFNNLRI